MRDDAILPLYSLIPYGMNPFANNSFMSKNCGKNEKIPGKISTNFST
jgi:hypothetical protein